LKKIGMPELDTILQIRKLLKIKDTYLEAFIKEQYNGYLHPSYNLNNVRTYRSSSEGPNFQNIPKRDKEAMKVCRRAILPRPGHQLVEVDFASLEVHIGACYHQDPVMVRYLQDKDSDMHADMAKQIFILDELDKSIPAYKTLRQAAKNGFVFPQFYGDYYKNNAVSLCEWVGLPVEGTWKEGMGLQLPNGDHISDHLIQKGIRSFNLFMDHIQRVEDDFWGRRFRKYSEWRECWVQEYRRKGYLQMYTGFVCSGVMRRNEIINYPIQGTAFHCLLKTFIELDKIMLKEGWRTRLVGQIHDSVLLDVYPEELEHVKQTVQEVVRGLPKEWDWIVVPLEVEIDEYEVNGSWLK